MLPADCREILRIMAADKAQLRLAECPWGLREARKKGVNEGLLTAEPYSLSILDSGYHPGAQCGQDFLGAKNPGIQ